MSGLDSSRGGSRDGGDGGGRASSVQLAPLSTTTRSYSQIYLPTPPPTTAPCCRTAYVARVRLTLLGNLINDRISLVVSPTQQLFATPQPDTSRLVSWLRRDASRRPRQIAAGQIRDPLPSSPHAPTLPCRAARRGDPLALSGGGDNRFPSTAVAEGERGGMATGLASGEATCKKTPQTHRHTMFTSSSIGPSPVGDAVAARISSSQSHC